MLKNNYICALDIGSSKISAVAVEIKNRAINKIFFDTVVSKSVKKGVIVDSLELSASVNKVLNNLREKSGLKIKFIYTNISGQDIITKHSHAIIPLAERGNKVINRYDVLRVNEQARVLGSSLEEEIVHQIPYNYAIDSKAGIANPIGLYSHRLEVDLYLICAKLASVQSLTRAVNQSGYDIRSLLFSGLATSSVVMDARLKNGINIFCDIGSDITELLVFRDGTLTNVSVLDVGGDSLTMELSEALKIPFELAEDVKRSYSSAGTAASSGDNREILIKKDNVYRPIKQSIVCDIITSKTLSICQLIKENVEKVTESSKVDSFVACGRTILLEGFLEALESRLAIPVKLGRIVDKDIISAINREDAFSGQKHLNYLTALGILCSVMQKTQPHQATNKQSSLNPFVKIANKVEEIYQEYF